MAPRAIGLLVSFLALVTTASGLSTAAQLNDPRDDPNRETQEHVSEQQSDNPLPPPLRVQIIEGDEEAADRAIREHDARERDNAHLIANQSIDVATQSLNAATQRMVYYTWWSNFFVGTGTFLLVLNLWLLGRANKTANDAVGATWLIGQAQSRAYIGVKFPERDISLNPLEPYEFEIEYTLRNYGNSPAMKVAAIGAIIIREFPLDNSDDFFVPVDPESPPDKWLAPGEVDTIGANWCREFSREEIDRAIYGEGNIRVYCAGIITYEDVFGTKHKTRFCVYLERNRDLMSAQGVLLSSGVRIAHTHNDAT